MALQRLSAEQEAVLDCFKYVEVDISELGEDELGDIAKELSNNYEITYTEAYDALVVLQEKDYLNELFQITKQGEEYLKAIELESSADNSIAVINNVVNNITNIDNSKIINKSKTRTVNVNVSGEVNLEANLLKGQIGGGNSFGGFNL